MKSKRNFEKSTKMKTKTTMGRYCFEHDSVDTDYDGECGTYATAFPDMKYRLRPCRFERNLWEWIKFKLGIGR